MRQRQLQSREKKPKRKGKKKIKNIVKTQIRQEVEGRIGKERKRAGRGVHEREGEGKRGKER